MRIVVLISMFLFIGQVYGDMSKTSKSKIRKFVKKEFKVDDFELKPLIIYNIIVNKIIFDNQNIGYLYKKNAKSCKTGGCTNGNLVNEYESYTFIILYNIDFTIKKVKVIDYNSSYGYEIMAKSWLKQFIGKGKKDLVIDSDVDAISGATISVQSIVNEVNKVNRIIRNYFIK